MAERGNIILVEGIGGGGKSTAIIGALDYLQHKLGRKAVATREPGGTPAAEKVRGMIFDWVGKGLIGWEGQTALYFAARKLWLDEVLKPNIDNGVDVICDRGYPSTVVYNGYGIGGDVNMIEKLADEVMQGYKPDGVILFDVKVEEARKRNSLTHKGGDPFDEFGEDFFRRTSAAYLHLAKTNWGGLDWYIVDANKSKEEVGKQVNSYIDKIIK